MNYFRIEKKYTCKIELEEDMPADDSEIYEKSDIIISLGGDGTMLSTAFHAHFYDKPVLGINLGKLGFLVETDIKNIDKVIEEIKNKKYKVEERMVIEGLCDIPSSEKLYAVNDIVIEKGGWPKMIELTAWVDGEYVTTFSADGLIVATPTGSTAYALSANGPILTPELEAITLVPICPHTLSFRPLVIGSRSSVCIRMLDSGQDNSYLSFDGQSAVRLQDGDVVDIKMAEHRVKLLRPVKHSHFDVLRAKLGWG